MASRFHTFAYSDVRQFQLVICKQDGTIIKPALDSIIVQDRPDTNASWNTPRTEGVYYK